MTESRPPAKYRITLGRVYEYREDQDAYVHIGALLNRTLDQFLYDLKKAEMDEDDDNV